MTWPTLPSLSPSDVWGGTINQALNDLNTRATNEGEFNVKNYGAVMDGSTDDTAAVSAAITAAVAVNGVLVFPAGTLKCGTVYVFGRVTLRFEGTALSATGSGDMFYLAGNDIRVTGRASAVGNGTMGHLFTLADPTGFYSDLQLTAASGFTDYVWSVYLGTRVRIAGLTVSTNLGGTINTNGTNDLDVSGLRIRHATGTLAIIPVNIGTNAGAGTGIRTRVHDVDIDGAGADTSGALTIGMQVGGNTAMQYVEVSDITIQNWTRDALNLLLLTEVTVRNVKTYNTGVTSVMCQRCTISDSIFRYGLGDGLVIGDDLVTGKPTDHVTVTGCIFVGCGASIPGTPAMNAVGLAVMGNASVQVTYVLITGCIFFNDNLGTQKYGVSVYQYADHVLVQGCEVTGNATAPVYTGTTGVSAVIYRGNDGYNPVGFAVTQPAVPATTVAQSNTTGVDCTVYVAGGTVTAVGVGGTATGATSGAFNVPAGSTITLTYSVAPTWKWFGA